MSLSVVVGAATAAITFAAAPFANMNGAYVLSPTPGQDSASFPTNFSDYPGGVEYFEVYHGPINSTYSEVYWTPMQNAIPADIVQRFAGGKVMAIVGTEIDQVMRVRDNATGELVDVSVPISFAYNHHHDSAIIGAGSRFVELPHSDPRVGAGGRVDFMHVGHGKVWFPEEHTPPKTPGASSSWT
jgi:hypothetical protein